MIPWQTEIMCSLLSTCSFRAQADQQTNVLLSEYYLCVRADHITNLFLREDCFGVLKLTRQKTICSLVKIGLCPKINTTRENKVLLGR